MATGAAIGLIYNALHGKIPHAYRLLPILKGFLRYYLAWVILSYAVVKIVPTQFPHLLANMDSTFAELTPMRVAWAFFGYSPGYQMLLGWGEAVPALLLLFHRTSTLGAFLMVPVLVQVLAVNVFFDVCVKLNSSIYLGIALALLATEARRLWAFFFSENAVPPPVRPAIFPNQKLRTAARVLEGLLVAGILVYTVFSGLETWKYLKTQDARTPVYGAWRIDKMEAWQDTAWAAVPAGDSLFLEKAFFQGQFGVLKGPLRRDRLTFDIDSVNQKLSVTLITPNNERPKKYPWQYSLSASSRLLLEGKLWEDSVRLECTLREDFLKK